MSLDANTLTQLKTAYQTAVASLPGLKIELQRALNVGAPVGDLQTRITTLEKNIQSIATHYPEVKSL